MFSKVRQEANPRLILPLNRMNEVLCSQTDYDAPIQVTQGQT